MAVILTMTLAHYVLGFPVSPFLGGKGWCCHMSFQKAVDLSFLISLIDFFFERERETDIDLLSHLSMHSLVDSCMCPHRGNKPTTLTHGDKLRLPARFVPGLSQVWFVLSRSTAGRKDTGIVSVQSTGGSFKKANSGLPCD